MTNKELSGLISRALVNDNDVYHGDVEKILDDIIYDANVDAVYTIHSKGNVVVIEGEFENGECIDIRVSFKDDMETMKLVEAF